MITVRRERSDDIAAVRAVNESAFDSAVEANLVDKLRAACADALLLVAVSDDRVVGHLLFSPATIQAPTGDVRGMALGPMAVVPEFQRRGVGSKLVRAGLEILRQQPCPFVIVLGHAGYYPRFGFVPASRHGIRCPWEGVPDEVFMVLILDQGVMSGVSGAASYRGEFSEAM